MAIAIKCPICNQTTSGIFCEHCGFEIHILPEPISDEVRLYEEEREKVYKERLAEQKRKEKVLSEQLSSAQKELENQKIVSEKTGKADQAKIDQLTKDLKQLSTDLEQRNKDLEKANRKVADAKGERPKAFLLFKGVGEDTVGAVYQGRNSYGCLFGGIDDPNHQELSIDGLKPLHFRIETIDDRFLLHDLVGDMCSANGELIGSKGRTLTNDTRFSIGKTIKVTFIIS